MTCLIFPSKKDGARRPALDARLQNKYIVGMELQLPTIAEVFAEIGTHQVVGILDASQAFMQLPLHEDHWGFFGIEHPTKGRFELRRLFFGMKNATAAWCCAIAPILSPFADSVVTFVDDSILHAVNEDDYVSIARSTLRALYEHNIVIKPAKSKHGLAMLEILGMEWRSDGTINPSSKSVEAFLNMTSPRDKGQLQSLVGSLNWLARRHIAHYSTLAAPITSLLKGLQGKPRKFPIEWSEDAQHAFVLLKRLMGESVVQLVCPAFNADVAYQVQLAVTTDASEIGMGGVLWQRILQDGTGMRVDGSYDGQWHILECYSQKFTAAERARNVTEKEALALVTCVQAWRMYLISRPFTVFTDHRNLVFMHSSTNRKVIRWSIALAEYQMTVCHIPGEYNVLADYLSRCGFDTLDQLPPSRPEAPKFGAACDTQVLWGGVSDSGVQICADHCAFEMESLDLRDADANQALLDQGFQWSHDRFIHSDGRVYIPEVSRPIVLVYVHEYAGHFGVNRMMKHLKAVGCWWRTMQHDCELLSRSVTRCTERVWRHSSNPSTSQSHEMSWDGMQLSTPWLMTTTTTTTTIHRLRQQVLRLASWLDTSALLRLLFPSRICL